ncbi:MAG: hypothetical protein HY241_16770 [Actinobacteria bacterium]|nr:hypothetical protein [Actinomycetota bacterium]
MTAVVIVVTVVASLATWITWTATRVDRLIGRTEAARSALDAQLVRRAAAAQALAGRAGRELGPELADRLHTVARAALEAGSAARESVENDLGRVLAALPNGLDPLLARDLAEAATRVVLARRFYNDAVRDSRALRGRWLPRLLRLGDRHRLPGFFEIDEVTLEKIMASG